MITLPEIIIIVIAFLFIIAVFATASSKRREKAKLEALREKGRKLIGTEHLDNKGTSEESLFGFDLFEEKNE